MRAGDAGRPDDDGLRLTVAPSSDRADPEHRFAGFAQFRDRVIGAVLGDDHHQADAAVEYAVHLVVIDLAGVLPPVELRRGCDSVVITRDSRRARNMLDRAACGRARTRS